MRIKKYILLILSVFFSMTVFSQKSPDAIRLSNLSYMEHSDKVNCDSTSGSNLEHKICLNLEFQELDSIMNSLFERYVKTIKSDTAKHAIVRFQSDWISNRDLQSKIASDGFQGHMLGIYYLLTMNNSTRLRIKELEKLLNYE